MAVRYALYCMILCFFLVVNIHILTARSRYSRLNEGILSSEGYRRQRMDSEMLEHIRMSEDPGRDLGLYWLENHFGQEAFQYPCSAETFSSISRAIPFSDTGSVQWSPGRGHLRGFLDV